MYKVVLLLIHTMVSFFCSNRKTTIGIWSAASAIAFLAAGDVSCNGFFEKKPLNQLKVDFQWKIVGFKEQILRQTHHKEQKLYLFNIDESKNNCLQFSSQADIYLWCKV